APPFAALAVNHWVPSGDCLLAPSDLRGFLTGRDLYVNNTDLSPVSSCTLLCMALNSNAIQRNTAHTVKQHTVNPLITPHVNPFLPSAISIVLVLLLALITVLVSLGMPVTPSQFPPV
ncbi:unnamed protein product, partial [Staurois parvus]